MVSPADAPAPISYLSSKHGLHSGSVVKIRSPKPTIAVTLRMAGGSPFVMKQVKCKPKPGRSVRCFKLTRHSLTSNPRVTLEVAAWNRQSPAAQLGLTSEVDDVKVFKGLTLRCHRVAGPNGPVKDCR